MSLSDDLRGLRAKRSAVDEEIARLREEYRGAATVGVRLCYEDIAELERLTRERKQSKTDFLRPIIQAAIWSQG